MSCVKRYGQKSATTRDLKIRFIGLVAGPRSAISRAPDS